MSEKHQCCDQIFRRCGRSGDYYPCKRTATVERDGKWYCSTHDPQAVKARRDKNYEKWRQKMDYAHREDAITRGARAAFEKYAKTHGLDLQACVEADPLNNPPEVKPSGRAD